MMMMMMMTIRKRNIEAYMGGGNEKLIRINNIALRMPCTISVS
jgi:hypothetical protein